MISVSVKKVRTRAPVRYGEIYGSIDQHLLYTEGDLVGVINKTTRIVLQVVFGTSVIVVVVISLGIERQVWFDLEGVVSIASNEGVSASGTEHNLNSKVQDPPLLPSTVVSSVQGILNDLGTSKRTLHGQVVRSRCRTTLRRVIVPMLEGGFIVTKQICAIKEKKYSNVR